MEELRIPKAPQSIQKGVPLKLVLGQKAVDQLGLNLKIVFGEFDESGFGRAIMDKIEPLSIKERAALIAKYMKEYLPNNYVSAVEILLKSLTPPLTKTEDLGLSGMFYMPHVSFIEMYGLDHAYNGGNDPFEISMKAQYELTKRFTSEFSIRKFLIDQPARTFDVLYKWMDDDDPHVRRLTSEGSRPRLPWAQKIGALVEDPSPAFPILQKLKDDDDLYVRRSVANHVGDIAKDNLDIALGLCESWLPDASNELRWLIRHALRHPAKKKNAEALRIRALAKKL